MARWCEHATVLAHHCAVLYPTPDSPGESGLCFPGQGGCVRAQLSCLLPWKRCFRRCAGTRCRNRKTCGNLPTSEDRIKVREVDRVRYRRSPSVSLRPGEDWI